MNKTAQQLGMSQTKYENVHGLSNNLNTSTCIDLTKLIEHAMQNKSFKDIVKTKSYKCKLTSNSDREIIWENTNVLL